MTLFLLLFPVSCLMNIYPFVQNGRKITDILLTQYVLYDSDIESNEIYYNYDFGDSSDHLNSTNHSVFHEYDFPGEKTVTVSKFNDTFISAYAQKRVNINHFQEFYRFGMSGPLELKNGSLVLEEISNSDSDSNFSSLRSNSITIPPNTSYWRLQVASISGVQSSLTSYYINSGIEPTIHVSNSSISIKIVQTTKEMWILKVEANEPEPVSVTARFDITTSNLLLNPVGCNIFLTKRVFNEDEYENKNTTIPKTTINVHTVPISPNSGIFIDNGSIYMSDDSFHSFRKLLFRGFEKSSFSEAVFSTLFFACIVNNEIYYRNYFLSDELKKVPNLSSTMTDVHLFALESDDIPRERTSSEIYDAAGPFLASFKSNNQFSILRFNGTTKIINLPTNVTTVLFTTIVSNINNIIALVYESSSTNSSTYSVLLNINFEENSITHVNFIENDVLDEDGNDQAIIGGYIHPPTESLVFYTKTKLYLTFDGGFTLTFVGKVYDKIVSLTSSHSDDEIYILDNEGNFYILFTERCLLHRYETYYFSSSSLITDASNTVYLISSDENIGSKAIPVDSYISTFVLDDLERQNMSLTVSYAVDNLYIFDLNHNNPNYFMYLSIYSRSGYEECKFTSENQCKLIFDGDVFSNSKYLKILHFTEIEDNTNFTIEFETSYLTRNDIGKSIVISEIMGVFEIIDCDEDEKVFNMTRVSSTISYSPGILEDVNTTVQLIDLKPSFSITGINGLLVENYSNNNLYSISTSSNNLNFSDYTIGLILESEDQSLKFVVFGIIDSNTIIVALVNASNSKTEDIWSKFANFNEKVFTFRPPNKDLPDEEYFSIIPHSKRSWRLQYSLCNGDVSSLGSNDQHTQLPVMYFTSDDPVYVSIQLPSSQEVQTRFSQPSLVKSAAEVSKRQVNYTLHLDDENIPFTRLISLYRSGSPRCRSISIFGVSPLCPANQRLIVTAPNNEKLVYLPTNYRPPSIDGNNIGLSPNVYNRDPENSKIMKSMLKISRNENGSIQNRCLGAKNKDECHCERAELFKMHEDDSDCLKTAYFHRFFDEFKPSVVLQAYIHGQWITIDESPDVVVKDINKRAPFCVNHVCVKDGDSELPFKTGDSILLRGIELWHLKFIARDKCGVSAQYMLYVERPPLMKNMVYLIQSITAITIGLILWFAVICVTKAPKRKRKQN
ncbi:hypothetical protein TRFO_03167 [Tritrichomonas foetus]|uniref:PKD domain-containing protein n=1 Tax=Tritrichomonas foetus TaxID=1144522 RepID=A0A1J4KWP4_9EUKA|nr:hypothetical protein TRFO_03167 [Tritrichomonas foetus]|eukprot:OHT14132.1 hypothetical protein TRFO_03167 [Tritrichomonas foetus]